MKTAKQSISALLRIRPLRTSSIYGKNGSLYFQITIDRVVHRVILNMNWPITHFDEVAQCLLPRFDKDEICYQNNMFLENKMADINRMKLENYISKNILSIEDFRIRINNKSTRESFLEYYDKKSDDLVKDGLVNQQTGKIYNTTKSRLNKYLNGKDWAFNTITVLEVQKFENWMRNNYSFNSMVNSMTVLKKFFSLAIVDGIIFNNPFDTLKVPRYTQGNREPLDSHELKSLKTLWLNANEELTPHQKDVLERYLFSCHTGLRQSEIEIFDTRTHYQNGIIKLNTIKGRRYNKKVNFRPPAFVNDIINGRRGRIFPPMESALLNKTLKIVARIAQIDKYLKFHSGRDTFATLYLKLGGNLADLKDILAHSSISTTEIYLKMNDEGKNDILSKFNEL